MSYKKALTGLMIPYCLNLIHTNKEIKLNRHGLYKLLPVYKLVSCYIYLLFLLATPLRLQAQKGLQPGATLYAGHFQNTQHNAYKPFLQALGFKPILISFCNTLCKDCSHQFERLKNLSRQFGKKVFVLAVVKQTQKDLQNYFEKYAIDKEELTVITDDSILHRLFPFHYVSHNVWVDKNGIIKAITEGDYLSVANIKKLINGELQLPLKDDYLIYDYKKRIITNQAFYYSGFSGFQPGARTGYAFDTIAQAVRLYAFNYSIPSLYLIAFGKNIFFPLNRILLQVQNKDRYLHNKSKYSTKQWYERFSYSYEQVLPLYLTMQDRRQKLIADLDSHFNLKGSIQNRNMPCYVLRCTDSALLSTKGGAFKNTLSGTSVKQLINAPINQLVYVLDKNSAIPVLDETGFNGKADVQLPAQAVTSLLDYNQILQKHGLILQLAERELEVLVITEKSKAHE